MEQNYLMLIIASLMSGLFGSLLTFVGYMWYEKRRVKRTTKVDISETVIT